MKFIENNILRAARTLGVYMIAFSVLITLLIYLESNGL